MKSTRIGAYARKKVKSSEYNANRLMITEMARVQTEAQRRSFEEIDFDQYTFHSFGTACPHCLAINGKHFKVKDMQPGLNAAPMHPNCRCAVSAYMERTDFGVSDEEVKLFDEWSEIYDDHGLSWKDWKDLKKNTVITISNLDIDKGITGKIICDKIITSKQKEHILDRHKEAYSEVLHALEESVNCPDFVTVDPNHPNTGLILKQ